ncbi:MAG: hypothetical protein HN721_06235, partial [Cryomorphaceae bacterium]|nr:hypothetical protein [Cryomorphaceae bacterium]
NLEKEEFNLNDNHIDEENITKPNEIVEPEYNHINEEKEIDFNDISDSELSNIEDDEIQFIKLDLDEEVSEDIEIQDHIHENEDKLDNEVEISENLFDKPLDTDLENENLIRRENLKQFNYVFKNKNSTIEDLEKIPAYKRMGIEITNTKSQNEDIFSKTILNEENKLEFPDVNTYLHDNVD